jgi:hypothetical protein
MTSGREPAKLDFQRLFDCHLILIHQLSSESLNVTFLHKRFAVAKAGSSSFNTLTLLSHPTLFSNNSGENSQDYLYTLSPSNQLSLVS